MSSLVALTMHVPAIDAASAEIARHGFQIDGDSVSLGAVRLELAETAPPHGLVAWSFRGACDERIRFDPTTLPPTDTRTHDTSPDMEVRHPNGVHRLDHVVAMVPRLETTVAGLEEYVGVACRRRGEVKGLPAAFLRAGDAVLEVVELRSLDGPKLWGVALGVDDCDKTVAVVREGGGHVTDPRRAVQGGRIAQVRGDVCGMTVAFVEPAAGGPP